MTIKILTLVLMAIFYACYLAKMFSQGKRGIATDQLGKGKQGFTKVIELALKITTYLILPVQIISIVLYAGMMPTALRMAGIIINAAGVLVFILSVVQMKDNWRAGVQREDKTELVTFGIYSVSRNPAFLGFDLMYIGILFSFFNWYLFFVTCVALALFHLQIVNVEEEFLTEAFGEEYLRYKKMVSRYIGRKKRSWTLTMTVLSTVLALVAIGIGFIAVKGIGISTGRYLEAKNGAAMIVIGNSPIRISGDLNFDKLDTGDEIWLAHDDIQETYPGGTKGYMVVKLGEGSETDIPKEVIEILTEMGWLE